MPSESMSTHVSKEWKRRILLMALFAAGAGCWFLYDGAIGYPKNNVRAEVYLPLKEKYEDDPRELKKQWAEIVREKGWHPSEPKKIYGEGDIMVQYIIAVVCFLLAVGVVGNFFWSLPRGLRLEGDELILPSGKVIDIHTIRHIDKRPWERKGIAKGRYESAAGRQRWFKLDDYKYVGTAEILEVIEQKLQPKDVDGGSESVSDEG